MGIGVNARTAFSLLFPPILDEFGWSRGTVAAAFSIGFIVSTMLTPNSRCVDGPLRPQIGNTARRCFGQPGPGDGALLQPALALLSYPRRLGGRRFDLHILYRPHAIFAQLVRPPPGACHRRRIFRRRRWLDHAFSLDTDIPFRPTVWRDQLLDSRRNRAGRFGTAQFFVSTPPARGYRPGSRRRHRTKGAKPSKRKGTASAAAAKNRPVDRIVDHAWAATEWTLSAGSCVPASFGG